MALGATSVTIVAIADDEAILAMGKKGTVPSLYALPEGLHRWKSLGPVPRSTSSIVRYFPAPSPGVLWVVPPINLSVDPAGQVFSAEYV